MLSTLTSSPVPVRLDGLKLLMEEREKRDILDCYLGDIQWAILCGLHSLAGKTCDAKSYSDMAQRIESEQNTPQAAKNDNAEVWRQVGEMISLFTPYGA